MSLHRKPVAVPIITEKLCKYGCNQVAKFQFLKGSLCCATHHNSCPAKRKAFSDRTDHAETAKKSLETRVRLGITVSSQVQGAATRIKNGFYENHRLVMQERWAKEPWTNNLKCPILSYKGLKLYYQGSYELDFLQHLEAQHGLQWIEDNVSRGPNIWYTDPTGIKRLYMSDFLIGNTIYEIKSQWTWNKKGTDLDLEKLNHEKLRESRRQGYIVKLILNKKESNFNE